jgi:NAD(P)-dependent dehydrogenase (short-subunit alcohol dehydrogenase family)
MALHRRQSVNRRRRHRFGRGLGRIDILVNNAGRVTAYSQRITRVWDTTLATHLDATLLLSKHAAAAMIKRKRGRSSTWPACIPTGAGLFPSMALPGAIAQLTKAMAVNAPHNIQRQ